MPTFIDASRILPQLSGDWALLWRPAPRSFLLTQYDWSAQRFDRKAGLALEAWRRWGQRALAPSPRCAGVVASRAPRRPDWPDLHDRVEIIAAGPDGRPLSLWALIAYGAQLFEASGAVSRDAPGWRARHLHPLWNGAGPVPGSGRRRRFWRGPERNLRLGSGSRKRFAGEAQARALEAEALWLETGEAALGRLRGLLRGDAGRELRLMPCRYDDSYPRSRPASDRSRRAKADSKARGRSLKAWIAQSGEEEG